jgi:hypothetical protein
MVHMVDDATGRGLARSFNWVALLLALSLPSCASSEEVRQRQVEAQAAAGEEDDAKCKAQGAEPDTPAYAQCRDRLAEKRAEQQAADMRRSESFQRTLGEGTSGLAGH